METDALIEADGSMKLLSPLPAWLKPGRAHVRLTVEGAPAAGAVREHSVVLLRHALEKEGVKAGAMGAVVHEYEGGAAYEVEFSEGRSRPCLVTLLASDFEVIDDA